MVQMLYSRHTNTERSTLPAHELIDCFEEGFAHE